MSLKQPDTVMDVAPDETGATIARGISKSFGKQRVLDDVSITIRHGETLALVGESGSGKSTLGRILVGLERADKGEIRVDGRRVKAGARAGVSMIFQDPYDSIDPRFTIEQIVGEPLGRRAPRDRVREMLAEVGLEELDLSSRPGILSGGQRQRLCIARAIIAEPDTLICDEATAALDAVAKNQILDLLLHLQEDLGLGMLFITHDLDIATRFADRIAVLENGLIVETGSSAAVSENPEHEYTQRLFASALSATPGHRHPRNGSPASGTGQSAADHE